MSDGPEIERLQVADIQPGDTIVATVPRDTFEKDLERLREALRERFPDNEILVVSGIQLTVGRVSR